MADTGIEIILLSNKGRAAVTASLEHFGLATMVAYVLAEEPGLPSKPDQDVFSHRIIPLLGDRAAADFIMVGDTAADVRFAQAVDIGSCWASYDGDPDACRALGPTFEIATFADLAAIVGGPNSHDAGF